MIRDRNMFGDSRAFFTLLNEAEATVFYFENPGPQILKVKFTLEMTNLKIQGSDEKEF